MAKSIVSQAVEALGALGVGAVLGIVYDFLRCARSEFVGRAFVFFCDVLFAAFAAAALFMYGIYSPSGSLTLYGAALSAAGAMLYFVGLGRMVRRLFVPIMRACGRICRLAALEAKKAFAALKKFEKFLKNIFSSAKKRFTIIGKAEDCANPHHGRKGQRSEVQKDRLSDESSYRGPDYLRRDQYLVDPLADIAGGE